MAVGGLPRTKVNETATERGSPSARATLFPGTARTPSGPGTAADPGNTALAKARSLTDREAQAAKAARFDDCQMALSAWHRKFTLAARKDLGYGHRWRHSPGCYFGHHARGHRLVRICSLRTSVRRAHVSERR
jgi:hypothetical protein